MACPESSCSACSSRSPASCLHQGNVLQGPCFGEAAGLQESGCFQWPKMGLRGVRYLEQLDQAILGYASCLQALCDNLGALLVGNHRYGALLLGLIQAYWQELLPNNPDFRS